MTEGQNAPEFDELRELLLGADRRRTEDLEARLDAQALTPEQIADKLPEAIIMRGRRDKQLARALAPTVQSAISESVRRRPGDFADAIFPILGPAIRKAIAETMAELVGSINRAVEHSFSPRGLKWRFEALRTGTPYAQVVLRHALLYRVEQVFLVHTETGLLLAKASPPDLATPDADLVSAMLTAIRDFVGDSFKQEKAAGGLRTFSVGELTVMVEPGPRALLAAVVRGQPADSVLLKLQETIEGVHAQFGSALEEFEGETAPFEATQPLLQECLVTVLDTDPKPTAAAVNWRPWAIGIALLIVVGFTLAVLAQRKWGRAMRALEATPGLMVVDAERSWGTWVIRGMRDPDAAEPNAVLAAAGVDTTRVRQKWEPYLSLQPAVVTARAARAFARPGRVQLAVRGDTLVAGGRAPLAWVAAVQGARTLPAGVAAINLSSVDVAIPAELQPLVDSLVGSRVLFDAGSVAPGAAGSEPLSRIAQLAGRLLAAVRTRSGDVQLDLIGRSDATGSDSANQALSRLRAEAVRRAISLQPAARGVLLVARWLGAAQPLDAADDAARARLNRSVSFEVRLLPHASSGPQPR